MLFDAPRTKIEPDRPPLPGKPDGEMASSTTSGEQEGEADGDDGLEALHPGKQARRAAGRSHAGRRARYHMGLDFNETLTLTGEVIDQFHFVQRFQAGLGDWSSCLTHGRGFPGIAGVPPA